MAGFKFDKVYWSEIDEYASRVYRRRFPDAVELGDITKVSGEEILADSQATGPQTRRSNTIRTGEEIILGPSTRFSSSIILCGGFPCQDISVAGKQAGLSGSRSGLFFEIIRLAKALSPRIIYLENVANLLSSNGGDDFGTVLRSLAEIGYDAEWNMLSAAAVGANHRRQRIWIVAYPKRIRWGGRGDGNEGRSGGEVQAKRSGSTQEQQVLAYPNQPGPQGHGGLFERGGELSAWQSRWANEDEWLAESGMGGGFDGLSMWLDESGGLSNEAKTRGREILSDLQWEFIAEAFQWTVGRFYGIPAEALLLTIMLKYEEDSFLHSIKEKSREVQNQFLRGLWRDIEFTRSSHQWEYRGKHSREYSNALRELPFNSSSLYAQTWTQSAWEDGIPRVETGIKNRVNRLKCLGNAVVPQCVANIAELVVRPILEGGRGEYLCQTDS